MPVSLHRLVWPLLALTVWPSLAQAQWAHPIRANISWGHVHDLAFDRHGSVYASFPLRGDAHIGHAGETHVLPNEKRHDGLIVKYTAEGEIAWTYTSYGPERRWIPIAMHVSGDAVYVGDSGTRTRKGEPVRAGTLTRLDLDGGVVWTKDIGVDVQKMADAPDGGVYVLGLLGRSDHIALGRYGADGEKHWSIKIPGGWGGEFGLAIDDSGAIWIAAELRGWVDLDPGPGEVMYHGSYGSAIVAQYDAQGTFVEAHRFGPVRYMRQVILATGADGDVYGVLSDSEPYGSDRPWMGADVSVIRFRSGRSPERIIPVPMNTRAITFDAAGNLYVGGYFAWAFDFDPGPGVYLVHPLRGGGGVKGIDAFVAKYSPHHQLQWVRAIKGPSYDSITAVAASDAGAVAVGGAYFGNVDFDPGTGIHLLPKGVSIDSPDAFVGLYTSDGIFLAPEVPTVAYPFEFLPTGANPFRGQTTLRLTSDQPQWVRVAVYDVAGRQVALPFEEFVGEGAQQDIEVAADGWPAGVYLVRATGTNAVVVQKLVVY